jgi:LTXXQ motif family protein
MTKWKRTVALAVVLAATAPVAAGAQDQKGKPGGAPARAAPAVHAAPHIAAPHIAAPHVAAPRMATPRMSTPHFAPHIAAPRTTTPHIVQQRAASRQFRSQAIVNHTAQQQQLRAMRQRHVPAAQAHVNIQAQRKVQINTQKQLRVERTLRRREDRELRHLPVAQRAARREQIRNAREQRALNRQQLAQPNALQAKPDANLRALRANRRSGTGRVTRDAARQGRFASRFASQAAGLNARNRFDRSVARHAWRRGHRAAFVAWYGPVFWPYAYADIFDYTFWPYGYDDGFWAYAYDDFFDGVFWGEYGPPQDYAYASPSSSASAPQPTYSAVQALCKQPGGGITAWPFADIERKVGLNADQRQLLGDVRKASQDAASAFKVSCPSEDAFPLTPPGRLSAMTARLDATLQAVQTVRPALEKFYDSLSDEQKERFNELGPKNTAVNAEAREASQAAEACKQPKQGLSNLPIEKIEDVINPTDAQEAELNKLQDATSKAVSIMQGACPDETPVTPPGRLDVMEKRLQAMIDAAKAVKPALESFYASLTNEQKARFNRIGQQLSRVDG